MNIEWIMWVAIIGMGLFVARKGYMLWNSKRRAKWPVPIELLEEKLAISQEIMDNNGFAKEDYDQIDNNCVQYAVERKRLLRKLLSPHRPDGQTEWMRSYSFNRDNSAGRHRVVAIKTTAGLKFIDSYPIKGNLYRTLSQSELDNGTYHGNLG